MIHWPHNGVAVTTSKPYLLRLEAGLEAHVQAIQDPVKLIRDGNEDGDYAHNPCRNAAEPNHAVLKPVSVKGREISIYNSKIVCRSN